MSKSNLVILAGGASSRMKKQSIEDNSLSKEQRTQANQRSKSLISIDDSGRPLMDYLLYNAKKAGYQNLYIITGKENSLFKSFYGEQNSNNDFHGLTINFAVQEIPKNRVKPFGTADALYQAMEQYPILQTSSFTVCNSDNLYSIKALELLRCKTESQNALISYNRDALLFSSERISRFALMLFDKELNLKDIIEKPDRNLTESFKGDDGKLRVSMNIFKFDGNLFFDYVKNCKVHPTRNEKELPTALMEMLKEYPNNVKGISLSEHVPDLTSKEDIVILKEWVKNIDLGDW
ncbi:MAG: sugar phosphate nucleotidyltransferase [Urechidicola sp.]|nr:sugar phosphate nucleotidyltransferase [Urechidicola sp.]